MSAAAALSTVSEVPTAGEESYFTVFAGGEAFGLSVLHTQTIFRITSVTPIPLGPIDIVGLVNLRGKIVTAVSLRRRLGIPVDEVGDVLTLDASMKVQTPAHFDPARSRFMAGLYKVGNLLVPALNIEALFDFAH